MLWEGLDEQDKREETSSNESRRPADVRRVRVGAFGVEGVLPGRHPEVAHLTKIERMAERPETEAHCVSEVQEFASSIWDFEMLFPGRRFTR